MGSQRAHELEFQRVHFDDREELKEARCEGSQGVREEAHDH